MIAHPLHLATLALLLTGAGHSAPVVAQNVWTASLSPKPGLAIGADGRGAIRLQCDRAGASIAVTARGLPRNQAGTEPFPTWISLFLGRTEKRIGATGTPTAARDTVVTAPIPDLAAFLDGVERQRRLVSVTFAGRTNAPAPDAGQLSDFRAGCAAVMSSTGSRQPG